MTSSKDLNVLQNQISSDLITINDWFQANELTLNIEKTELEPECI